MNIQDLGPLETAALRALAQAELIGAPLSVASVWRSMAGYTTSLPNVRAALEEGQPLRSFVAGDKDFFVLAGRDDLLRGMATRQGRSDERWRDLEGSLRGLGKLPWVEAVGVTGTMAWGLLDGDEVPCELVIIAEGGRVPLARAAVRAWRRAARLKDVLRIAAVLDADDLALTPAGATAAWWLLAVRPVVNEHAFARLLAANPWAGTQFPNFSSDASGGMPEYFLGDRVDGKLAAARRAAVATEDDGVLLLSGGRKDAGWETALLGVVTGRSIATSCREWGQGADANVLAGTSLSDGDARVDGRMAEVAGWSFGDPEGEAVEPEGKPAKARPAAQSTRDRGPKTQRASSKRPPRSTTAAAPEG